MEFYCRRIVVVKGDRLEDGMFQIKEIIDTGETLIEPPGEEQAILKCEIVISTCKAISCCEDLNQKES